MIYAIIIIAALAAAFVILIRRLPEAANQSGQSRIDTKPAAAQSMAPTEPKAEKKGFSFSMPSIQLPKIKLPEAAPKPESVMPSTPPASSPTPAAPVSKPKFTFPSWSNKTSQPAPSSSTKKDSKDDFWAGIDEEPEKPAMQPAKVEKPVVTPPPAKPTPAPAPTPAAPKPTTPLFSPFTKERAKPKPKDTFQEAEDLFAIKDYRKAEAIFLQLASTDPKNPKIYSRLGVIYMEQSNFEDARDALQQAIKLEPGIASRHFNLALAYANLGSKSKAVTSMESALKYDPSNRKYRKMLDELLSSR